MTRLLRVAKMPAQIIVNLMALYAFFHCLGAM
jgi:hypothetical protein